jgi:dUTPase
MQVIDKTGHWPSQPVSGQLFVKRDPDQSFIPGFAKDGDVGLDLPVKISIDHIKFAEAGDEPGRLRSPMLYPDLQHYINLDNGNPYLEIPAFGWAEIPSGFAVKIPDDAWGLIKTRSGTAWKRHLHVSVSTIDPGYTGLLGTLVHNPNQHPVRVFEYDPETGEGDCLSQLILIPRYPLHSLVLVDQLPETERGDSGFGSTTKSIQNSDKE